MAVIKDLAARQDVERGMAQVGWHLANRFGLVGQFGKILSGQHRLDTRQPQRPVHVDRFDDRVSMRAAQDLPMQHVGKGIIRSVLGAARDLVHAVMAHGTRSDNPEFLCRFFSHGSVSSARPSYHYLQTDTMRKSRLLRSSKVAAAIGLQLKTETA